MAEKWEEELERLLAAQGVLYGETIEIPPWSRMELTSANPEWCEQDSWVGNHIISELDRRLRLSEERSGAIPLGDKLKSYLQSRQQVVHEYVKPLFAGAHIELELDLDDGSIRYTKPFD